MSHPFSPEQTATTPAPPELTKSTLEVSSQAIRRIHLALMGLEQGAPTPREQLALAATAVVGALGAVVLPFAASNWLGLGAQVLVTCVMASATYLAFRLRSKLPNAWAEVLDKRLAEYTPLNREALLGMQRELQDAGYLDVAIVRAWFDDEQAHHASLARRQSDVQAHKFLARVL